MAPSASQRLEAFCEAYDIKWDPKPNPNVSKQIQMRTHPDLVLTWWTSTSTYISFGGKNGHVWENKYDNWIDGYLEEWDKKGSWGLKKEADERKVQRLEQLIQDSRRQINEIKNPPPDLLDFCLRPPSSGPGKRQPSSGTNVDALGRGKVAAHKGVIKSGGKSNNAGNNGQSSSSKSTTATSTNANIQNNATIQTNSSGKKHFRVICPCCSHGFVMRVNPTAANPDQLLVKEAPVNSETKSESGENSGSDLKLGSPDDAGQILAANADIAKQIIAEKLSKE